MSMAGLLLGCLRVVCCSLIWSVDIWVSLVRRIRVDAGDRNSASAVLQPRCNARCNHAGATRCMRRDGRRTGDAGGSTMRAREPDEQGYVERDGVRGRLRVLRRRRRSPCCSARSTRSCTAGSGRRRCPTWRATSGWSRSTRAATARSDRPSDPAAYGDLRVRRRHDRGDGRPRHRAGRPGRHLLLARGRRWSARRCTPTGCSAWWRSRRRSLDGTPPLEPQREAAARFDEELPSLRRLVQVQPPLLAAGLAGLRGVLLRRALQRAALHQAARGRRRLGAWRAARAQMLAAQDAPAVRHDRRGGRADAAHRSSARCWSSTAPTTAASRRALRHRRRHDRRRAPGPRGRRPPADGPRPGRGQPGDQGVHRPGHRSSSPAAGAATRGPADGRGCST